MSAPGFEGGARAQEAGAAPLIVTLRLGDAAAARFTALRRAHFPSGRNWLDAHVTLFHALPGTAIDAVVADATAIAAATPPFVMRTARLRYLGAGVAYALASPEAEALRRALVERWSALLGRQDRAKGGDLHITVQNKVAPAAARDLYERLSERFVPENVPGVGLDVWHYEGGPWRAAAWCPFGVGVGDDDDDPRS